jgi:hypothetical protein
VREVNVEVAASTDMGEWKALPTWPMGDVSLSLFLM